MISLQDELLTSRQVAERLPVINGKGVTTATVWRWARVGIRGIRLEHLKLGGRILTTMEAVDRFCNELSVFDVEINVTSEEDDS